MGAVAFVLAIVLFALLHLGALLLLTSPFGGGAHLGIFAFVCPFVAVLGIVSGAVLEDAIRRALERTGLTDITTCCECSFEIGTFRP